MEHTPGVYVMQVASMLTGMHPQTLRKYERAGFLTPSRSKKLRLYSNEDIARLLMIKRLVDVGGLNLAGVEMALKLRAIILDVKGSVNSRGKRQVDEKLSKLLDKVLETLGNSGMGEVE